MSLDKLAGMLSFTNVAIGDTATLPHGLILNGVSVVPDLILLQYQDTFELAGANAQTITLRNTADTGENCLAYVSAIHPAIRLLGIPPDDGNMALGMVPRPFCPGTPNTGGGGNAQAFDYTVTGSEPDRSAITITIPTAMADVNYEVMATIQGGTALAALGVSTKATTNFVLDATGDLPAGMVIGFVVIPKT